MRGGSSREERRRERGRERERERDKERGGGGSTVGGSGGGRRKPPRRPRSDDSDDESPETKKRLLRTQFGGNSVLQSAMEELLRRQAQEKSQQEQREGGEEEKKKKKRKRKAGGRRRGDDDDDDDDSSEGGDDEREEGEATPENNGVDADTDKEMKDEEDDTPVSEGEDDRVFELGMRPIRWDRPEEVAEIAAEAVQSLPKKLVGLQARAEAEATAEEELEKMRRAGDENSDEEGDSNDQDDKTNTKRGEDDDGEGDEEEKAAAAEQALGGERPGKSPDIQRPRENSECLEKSADKGEAEVDDKANSDDERFQNLGVVGCRSVDCFEPLNKIQEGSYGIVYRAKEVETGKIVALKKVKLEKETRGFPQTALREVNVLLSLRHENIVSVREVVVGKRLDEIFMVMEFVEHDLKSLMQAMKNSFTTAEVKCLMKQLFMGTNYLHENWVLHRDLKSSNILYSNKGEIKICDFGLARAYGSPLKPYTFLVVTLWYRAPELLLGSRKYSTAIDMWSLGCIMAELLSKKPLFEGKTEIDQIDKIFRLLGTPNEKMWPTRGEPGEPDYLPGWKDLYGPSKIKHTHQPYNFLRDRYPKHTLKGGPTLTDHGFNLLNKLLTYDPQKRITAYEALNHPWFKEFPLAKDPELMPTYPSTHEKHPSRGLK